MTKLIRAAASLPPAPVGSQADGVVRDDRAGRPRRAASEMRDVTGVTADGIMRNDLTVAAREVARSSSESLLILYLICRKT